MTDERLKELKERVLGYCLDCQDRKDIAKLIDQTLQQTSEQIEVPND